jgi:hypothetical protein
VVGGIRTTISTSELRISQKRIEVEEQNRKGVQSKREVAADSLQTIQLKILDVESSEGVSSELGPLEYLSGLLDRPMDVIINWFILIIIFVFDPLAVALVIAFSNALKVDRGIVDKEKVIRKRELYDEIPEDEDDDSDDREEHLQTIIDNDQEMGLWDNTINDGLEDDEDVQDFLEQQDSYESDDSDKLFTVAGMTNDKEQSFNEFQKKQDEFDKADLNQDGIITEEEQRIDYENTGWRNSFKGAPFYTHPWFDWSKRERWINDREATNFWLNNKGGNRTALADFREKTKYPDNFDSKTY